MANSHVTHTAVTTTAPTGGRWPGDDLRKKRMGKLTAAKRGKIPSKEFGEPSDRKYPMPDKAHAINAKARATQMMEQGKLSKSEHAKITSKADRLIYG